MFANGGILGLRGSPCEAGALCLIDRTKLSQSLIGAALPALWASLVVPAIAVVKGVPVRALSVMNGAPYMTALTNPGPVFNASSAVGGAARPIIFNARVIGLPR